MKTIDKIPVTKIQRATKLVSTGAKVGVNYLKYYGDKLVNTEVEDLGNYHKLVYLACFTAGLIK